MFQGFMPIMKILICLFEIGLTDIQKEIYSKMYGEERLENYINKFKVNRLVDLEGIKRR